MATRRFMCACALCFATQIKSHSGVKRPRREQHKASATQAAASEKTAPQQHGRGGNTASKTSAEDILQNIFGRQDASSIDAVLALGGRKNKKHMATSAGVCFVCVSLPCGHSNCMVLEQRRRCCPLHGGARAAIRRASNFLYRHGRVRKRVPK